MVTVETRNATGSTGSREGGGGGGVYINAMPTNPHQAKQGLILSWFSCFMLVSTWDGTRTRRRPLFVAPDNHASKCMKVDLFTYTRLSNSSYLTTHPETPFFLPKKQHIT